MSYRALLLDFDGTLVNDKFEIEHSLEIFLKELQRSGIYISIVTGKPYYGIVRFITQKLALTAPQIVSAGAQIISPVSEESLYARYIDATQAQNIVSMIQSSGYVFAIEQDDIIYISDESLQKGYGGKGKFLPIDTWTPHNTLKILISSRLNKQAAKFFYKILADISGIEITRIQSIRGYGCDVTASKVNKYSAIKKYQMILNLKQDELVCVGDGLNDMSMFDACGYRIALNYGPEGLKIKADRVINSLFDDGIKVLREMFR